MSVPERGESAIGVAMPIEPSVSCDSLAASARGRDWTHTGIVVSAWPEVFQTIEGNTNDEGSREGYEVCARTRGYKDVDFILV